MSTFEITANGTLMGEYRGDNEDEALDAFARDAGYDDYSDLLANVPGSSRDEDEVFEIDTDKLIAAVSEASGQAVFQDSYGDGIALVNGVSYSSYRDLAEAFGVEMAYC